MSDLTVIHNARLLRSKHASERYKIRIEKEIVCAIEPMAPTGEPVDSADVVDVAGDWITLGAVDLQINGALGLAFPNLRIRDFERLEQICDLLWQQGVDAFCPTLVTTSLDNFHGALTAIQQFKEQQSHARTAQVLGAHLEGPFLNINKRGAHPQQFIQPLSIENVKTVVGDFIDAVVIMTLAPECVENDGVKGAQAENERAVEWLSAQGVTVSLGHSLATAEQASRAFEQGASMVTHAFNAMPSLHHREPGLLGAALTDSRVACGFIADGQHICPTMLDLLLRTQSDDLNGLFLVSDALSPLGLPDGTYPWDTREIEVVNGTARLADGTLSGTTLPLIKGAQNLVDWELCGLEEAIELVTRSPRKAVGLSALAVGSRANLLRWRKEGTRLSWSRLFD